MWSGWIRSNADVPTSVPTDFPFDMGETDPVGLVGRVPGLDDADRTAVAGGNAQRLFGL